MKKEELLRRLEERLARGEISERTYLDIKARYDAMGDEPEPPEPPAPEAPPAPSGEFGRDLEGYIQRTIERAMGEVAQGLQSTLGSAEFDRRMDDAGRKVEEAVARFGTGVQRGDRKVVIRGSGTIAGAEGLDEFRCSGSGRVDGDLQADEVHISGACKIEGACECDEFQSSGSSRVNADLKADEVSNSGALQIGGNLQADEVQVSGSLDVAGWVKTDEFTSRGRFTIGGGLEADEVEVRLAGTSRVPTIRAQEVRVQRGKRNGELEADLIEGDEIYLEATRARRVKGGKVRIGPFCTIGSVEARELEIHETSEVKEQHLGPVEGATPPPGVEHGPEA